METEMKMSFLGRHGVSLAVALAVVGGASFAFADDWSAPNYTPSDTPAAATAEMQAMGATQQPQATATNSAYYNFPGGSWSSGQYGPWDNTDAAAAEMKDLAKNPAADHSAQ
jgi:hypothetical protein